MTHRISNGSVSNLRRTYGKMLGAARVGVVVLVAVVAGCSSGGQPQASRVAVQSASPPRPVSYLARSGERADLLQWTSTGEQVSGSVDSRWVSARNPLEVQSRWVNFRGTLNGPHLTITPDDGSGSWVGTVDPSHVVLRWTSGGTPMTTTFLVAGSADFDAVVRVLGAHVAVASARAAAANASAVAAAKAQAKQAQQARAAAAQAAALARAERGRISAAKAAAHRRGHR